MKISRFILFIVLLDIIALITLATQAIHIYQQYSTSILLSEKVQAILLIPLSLFILIGILYLLQNKKSGFILYYIQFPFRLYLWVFSIGFITYIPEILDIYNEKWASSLFKVCFLFEFIRLYFTIKAHLNWSKQV